MLGHLIYQNGNWMVRHDDNGIIKVYPLCPQTQKWSEKPDTKRFIKEDIEVVFDFVIKGEYCETKEQMIKNYFAKIKRVEHENL